MNKSLGPIAYGCRQTVSPLSTSVSLQWNRQYPAWIVKVVNWRDLQMDSGTLIEVRVVVPPSVTRAVMGNGPHGRCVHRGDGGVIASSGTRTTGESSYGIGDGSGGYIHSIRKNNTVGSRKKEQGGHSKRKKVFWFQLQVTEIQFKFA